MAGDAVKCLGWITLCKKLKSQSLFPTHQAKAHLHRQLLLSEAPRKGLPLCRQDRLFPPAAHGGRGCVVLIDEYDDPVATLLHKPAEAEAVREMLAAFYRQMKDRTGDIRFLMITGVSKFTKMSVFSALSNLVDLSFRDEYATMLGYTEEELDEYFDEPMRAPSGSSGLVSIPRHVSSPTPAQ